MPGRVSAQAVLPAIKPLEWKGSGDLFTLASANAFLVRAANEPATARLSKARPRIVLSSTPPAPFRIIQPHRKHEILVNRGSPRCLLSSSRSSPGC